MLTRFWYFDELNTFIWDLNLFWAYENNDYPNLIEKLIDLQNDFEISIYPPSLPWGRIQHKVNFKSEYSWFEFSFFLLDWLPY